MSADTSGACCQGKLTYPAMSTPTIGIHGNAQPFRGSPRETRRWEVRGDYGAVGREVKLRSLSGHEQQQNQSALVFLKAELKASCYQILNKCVVATAATAAGT